MARTPTVYRWDDPGAPDLNAIMPTSNDKGRLWVHTVLRACLVDGYGAQQAAGWTMPHEEITSDGCRFVLENAAHSGSLLYEGGAFSGGSTNHGSNTLWVCSAVPDMDSPVNAWSDKVVYSQRGAETGSNFHCIPVGMSYWWQWVVIANENTVMLICAYNGEDFNLASTGTPRAYGTSRLYFGAMHDGSNLGGVAMPKAGNFYILGGLRDTYSGGQYRYNFLSNLLTTNVGIAGLNKSGLHTYTSKLVNQHSTNSSPNAWLPSPYMFVQYGDSGPDGASAQNLHFCISLVGLRKLVLYPGNQLSLQTWMNSNSFEFGKAFSYLGGQWLVVKSSNQVMDLISLDPSEWGA